ncbi:MAG TPA: hypothetical protein VM576_07015 [Xanthomonadaceae bacterium]|jgi:hypothetical protein|nr:hypothetical protein [Xanthomonadaceae bacterium]
MAQSAFARQATVVGEAPVTHLLWTGGWDSTFRLLELLLEQGRVVQPHYLEDPSRPSTAIEIETMARIRGTLALQHPDTRALLLPTQFHRVWELPQDASLDAAFMQARASAFMGDQYAWLARFCRGQHLPGLELCIHRDDKAHAVLERFVVAEGEGAARTWRCDPARAGSAEHTLFGDFAFPLFESSKLDMARRAREQGWHGLMAMTWFCHRPRDGQPCGCCNPCLYTIEEGLGWRIPRRRRAISALYRVFVRPLRPLAKAMLQRFNGRAGERPPAP